MKIGTKIPRANRVFLFVREVCKTKFAPPPHSAFFAPPSPFAKFIIPNTQLSKKKERGGVQNECLVQLFYLLPNICLVLLSMGVQTLCFYVTLSYKYKATT